PMPIELVQAIMPVLVRSMLRTRQGLAALESVVFNIAHLQADHEVCQAMRLTGRYFVQEAQRLRLQHRQEIQNGVRVVELDKLGVPRPHLWLTLVGALQQQGDRVGAQTAAIIKTYMDTVKADQSMTNETLDSHCRFCKIGFTHDRATMKIFLEASGSGIQVEVLAGLVQIGASIKRGTPPRSHQERLMQLALDGMENLS
ncbi:unnamed protein product, partial [Prorocentrum cordatum]